MNATKSHQVGPTTVTEKKRLNTRPSTEVCTRKGERLKEGKICEKYKVLMACLTKGFSRGGIGQDRMCLMLISITLCMYTCDFK